MHGNNLYLPQLNVPLLILPPDGGKGQRVSETVSLRDLPNTILDLAEVDGPSPFPGTSLTRLWATRSTAPLAPDTLFFSLTGGFGPPVTPLARGNMWSVIADPGQYILNGNGDEELYDIRRDPSQQDNRIAVGRGDPLLDRLRLLVQEERADP
jgi:arylsulfatase A-like enzyme